MKSKIYILISLLLLVCFSSGYTKPVNIETAKLVAKNWYYERAKKHVKNAEIRDVFMERDNSENIFYIFNLGEKGFVIVAADDVSIPILGYSSENNYTGKNRPPAFEFLMRMYKMQIIDEFTIKTLEI